MAGRWDATLVVGERRTVDPRVARCAVNPGLNDAIPLGLKDDAAHRNGQRSFRLVATSKFSPSFPDLSC